MLTPTMTQTETLTHKCEGETFDEPLPGDEPVSYTHLTLPTIYSV